LKADDPESYVAVAAFLITAIVVSQTALRARERKRETEQLYELGQAMLASDSLQSTVWVAINHAIPILGVSGAAFYLQANGEMHRAGDRRAITGDALRAGSDVHRDKRAGTSLISIRMGEERIGTLAFASAALSPTILKSIANLVSTVLERVR